MLCKVGDYILLYRIIKIPAKYRKLRRSFPDPVPDYGTEKKETIMKKKLLSLLLGLALILPFFSVTTAPSAAADGNKLIAITFDDGPGAYTSSLLDGLASRGVPATFFMCGANGSYGVKNYNSLLSRMVAEGHQLANHSWGHPTFSKISGSEMQNQLNQVGNYLTSAMGGNYNYLVRIPGGENNATIRANVNHPMITWSVDPLDWKYHNADTVYNNIMKAAGDGSIILLHDIYQTSVQGGLRAIDTLKSQGYEFVTVSELFRRRGIALQNNTVYSNAPNRGTTLPAYAAPTISASGSTVSVSANNNGVTLHYTTDGTTPTLASPVTNGTITLNSKVTLKVAGFDSFGTRTPVATQQVDANVAEAPVIASAGNGTVILTSKTPGAVIRYTTDGSEPNAYSTVASGGTMIPGSINKAIATASGKNPSAVTTFYTTEYGDVFYDVPPSAWYYTFIGTAVNKQLMVGMKDFLFEPATKMTRAMLVTVLYSMEGKPAVGTSSPFSDVASTAWYASPIIWAAQNKLVSGIGGGKFAPGTLITRQQAAAIIYQYALFKGKASEQSDLSPLNKFSDRGQISDYARPAMAWAVASGLMNGVTATTLQPGADLPRAQCATMMVGFDKHINPPTAAKSVTSSDTAAETEAVSSDSSTDTASADASAQETQK